MSHAKRRSESEVEAGNGKIGVEGGRIKENSSWKSEMSREKRWLAEQWLRRDELVITGDEITKNDVNLTGHPVSLN